MVSKRWGQRVLEIFEVNRAMMELDEDGPRGEDERHLPPGHPRSSATRQRDSGGRRSPRVDEWQEGHGARDEQEGPGLHRAAPGFGEAAADDLKVRRFSEDSQDSQGSSGAKVFPEREIVAGNRKAEDREDDMELAQAVVDGGPDSIEQQELLDTQLDGPGDPMPWTLSHLARLLMWWLQRRLAWRRRWPRVSMLLREQVLLRGQVMVASGMVGSKVILMAGCSDDCWSACK